MEPKNPSFTTFALVPMASHGTRLAHPSPARPRRCDVARRGATLAVFSASRLSPKPFRNNLLRNATNSNCRATRRYVLHFSRRVADLSRPRLRLGLRWMKRAQIRSRAATLCEHERLAKQPLHAGLLPRCFNVTVAELTACLWPFAKEIEE